MKYNKAFKFRAYPDKQQEELIHKTFGCARFVFNRILGKAKEIYEIEKKNTIITPATLKKEFDLGNKSLDKQRNFCIRSIKTSCDDFLFSLNSYNIDFKVNLEVINEIKNLELS